MTEFRFFCPQCGQHIQCGTGYAGAQINCPTCKQPIVVPPVAPVPPAAPSRAIRQGTPTLAIGQPPFPVKSRTLRNIMVIAVSMVVLAGLIVGGWFGYSKIKLHGKAGKLPPGLVTLWSGDGDASDNVGGSKGRLMNGAGFAPGKTGQAFDLNTKFSNKASGNGHYPGGGYVQIPASPALDVGKNGGFTFTAWINPAKFLYQMPIMEYEKTFGTSDGLSLGVIFYVMGPGGGGAGPGCLYANILGVPGAGQINHEITSAAGLVTINTWQQVALVYDQSSGMAAIYLNGTSVLQTNIGSFTPDTSGGILLGGRTVFGSVSSPSGIFSGKLENLGIYNRALSAAEIQAVYANQK